MSEPTPHAIYGRDALEIVELVEGKSADADAQLTLLTAAISLVAIHHGVRLRDLRRGLEASFRQTVRLTPNYSAARGFHEEQ